MPFFVFFVPLCESKETHCTQKIFLFFVTEDQGIRSLIEVSKAILPYMILFFGSLLAITYIPDISLLLPKLFLR